MRFPTRLLRMDNEHLICDGEEYHCSLKASTKATYSLSNRAYFFEGNVQTGFHHGTYATRIQNGADAGTLLCLGVHAEPHYDNFDYAFFVRCNAKGSFARAIGGEYSVYKTDVVLYKTTTTRSDKAQNDGLLDQTIYICYFPASIGAKKDDVMTFYDPDINEPYSGTQFRIDSIDDGLTLFGNRMDGVASAQLSFLANDVKIDGADGGNDENWG